MEHEDEPRRVWPTKADEAANGEPDESERVDTLSGVEAVQRWARKKASLAARGRAARRTLIESEARRREFRFLDEQIGRRPDEYPEIFDDVAEAYLSGRFFLKELGLFFEVSPWLSLTALELRAEWVRQYDLKTVPELMLLDQAMLAFFNQVRLHQEISKMLSLLDEKLYYGEDPHERLNPTAGGDEVYDPQAGVEQVRALQRMLLPGIERMNRMFVRNLRAMGQLRADAVQVRIDRAGQVNVAEAGGRR